MADLIETTDTDPTTEQKDVVEETEEVTKDAAGLAEAGEIVADDATEDVAVDTADEEADAEEAGAEEAGAEEADAAVETAEEAGAEGGDDDADTGAAIEPPPITSPYDLPGDWYVIHSYSGYENKVKANLETRIQSMHMEDRIFEVHIPMEDVVEFKGGKKVTVPKKVFPGYILVRMTLDDDSWYAVRNTPGVTGFVAGNAQKPTPLSRREVERFLGVQEEEEKGKPRFKPEWDVGEQVRVVTGPFADFNGVIEELNVDQQKVVVLVNIFGRDTPVELGFDDIQKS